VSTPKLEKTKTPGVYKRGGPHLPGVPETLQTKRAGVIPTALGVALEKRPSPLASK
jgi:hypothetical protein